MLALTDQTATATATRTIEGTLYEVSFEGVTYSRIAGRAYRWATIVETPYGHRRAAWSSTNEQALHPKLTPSEEGAHVVAVILLAQPE